MATFDDATVGTSTGGTTPDFRASKKSEPAVRSVQFGDGYQQRITFGLNQDPKEFGT
jgi:phage-related protein